MNLQLFVKSKYRSYFFLFLRAPFICLYPFIILFLVGFSSISITSLIYGIFSTKHFAPFTTVISIFTSSFNLDSASSIGVFTTISPILPPPISTLLIFSFLIFSLLFFPTNFIANPLTIIPLPFIYLK